MRRLAVTYIAPCLMLLLLVGCGDDGQPSGPPPLAGVPSSTVVTSATATPGPGTTLLTYHPSDNATSLVWSPDDTRIATGSSTSRGGVIQVWDASTGQQLLSFGSPMASIASLAWSPDGTHIAAAGRIYGGDNAGVRIWDASTGAVVVAIATVSDSGGSSFDALAWSPDGSRIAGAGGMGSFPTISEPNPPTTYLVQVWDTKTGKPLQRYFGHKDQIKSLAWSPDSKLIASASNDHSV